MNENVKTTLKKELKIFSCLVGLFLFVIAASAAWQMYFQYLYGKYNEQHAKVSLEMQREIQLPDLSKSEEKWDSLQQEKLLIESRLRETSNKENYSSSISAFGGSIIGLLLIIVYPIRGVYLLFKGLVS